MTMYVCGNRKGRFLKKVCVIGSWFLKTNGGLKREMVLGHGFIYVEIGREGFWESCLKREKKFLLHLHVNRNRRFLKRFSKK